MRRLFAWSVACSLAVGCSEADTPVEPPADGGDTGALDAISDTGEWTIDSTVDSSEPDATDTSIDTADAPAETTPDADAMTADADAASPDADAVTADADASPGDADAADAAADADASSPDADGGDASPDATDASGSTELWVVRVGDDMATLDFAAHPASIDRVQVSSGTGMVVGSIALPTTPSGIEQAFTLPGTSAPGSGLLTRSSDGRFVTMGGYAAPVGTADVAYSSTVDEPPIARVVARIDGARTVSTSTTTNFYDYSQVNSVVTDNGSRFWLAGFGNGIVYLGGFGSSVSGTFISTGARFMRSATLIDGALYGVNRDAPTMLFNFDSALPISASTPVGLPGGPTTGGPHSMVGFARGTSGVDLLYVCDAQNMVDGGGLQRWTKTSGTWSRAATLAPTTTNGCHAIAGSFAGGLATLYVVATGVTASVVKFVDDPSSTIVATPSLIMSATPKKAIRGIALAPTP